MPHTIHTDLAAHLLRDDGQEDLCMATYSISTGGARTSRLLRSIELPLPNERQLHGNASLAGGYVLRVAAQAAKTGRGVVLLHSHPRGAGWQALSSTDHDTELSFARLARRLTGFPLVGMTLAGRDEVWSARAWDEAEPTWSRSVRVVGPRLKVDWNGRLVPPPPSRRSQLRTVSAWGEDTQANCARLRVLVVGVGSVGLEVAQRLAATGIRELGVMDYDVVEEINLDRMVGATSRDAASRTPKVQVAARLMRISSTASDPVIVPLQMSVCSPEGLATALDYDLIFSCVDRPWPRAVLNAIAYSDLIPVIDGGIDIGNFSDGRLRRASWRSHTLVPGRPCLACSQQLSMEEVPLAMQGLLEDPAYIERAGRPMRSSRSNVAALSASVSAAQLAQFVSLVAAPGGQGVPAPLRYILGPHVLEHLPHQSLPHCRFEQHPGEGDNRPNFVREVRPQTEVMVRKPVFGPARQRICDALDRLARLVTPH